jgi:nicotinamidase-related amidase
MANDAALMVIDVQNGLFDEGAFEPERLLKQVKSLIDHARSNGVPVIYVQHNEDPKWGGSLVAGQRGHEIHASIAPQPGDTIIQKWNPSAFMDTNLQAVLEEKGIKRLVLSGMQSEVCVDTTCRDAYSRGYNVILASNAHSTMDNEVLKADQIIKHHNATLRMFAKVTPTEEIEFSGS